MCWLCLTFLKPELLLDQSGQYKLFIPVAFKYNCGTVTRLICLKPVLLLNRYVLNRDPPLCRFSLSSNGSQYRYRGITSSDGDKAKPFLFRAFCVAMQKTKKVIAPLPSPDSRAHHKLNGLSGVGPVERVISAPPSPLKAQLS